MFFKIIRKRFSTEFHHGFIPGHIPENTLRNALLGGFDTLRVVLYIALIYKAFVKAPSFILFRRSEFKNNPDFRLLDRESLEKLK